MGQRGVDRYKGGKGGGGGGGGRVTIPFFMWP